MNSIQLYLKDHWRAARNCARWLCQMPFASALTVLVIAIALALPAGFGVFVQNARALGSGLQQGAKVSLYLEQHLDDAKIAALVQTIRLRNDVVAVQTISPEAGLALFERASGFSDVVRQLPENPLPTVIEIYPSPSLQTAVGLEAFYQSLRQLPHVESAQMDMMWLQRLHALLQLFTRLALMVMGLFCVAVLLIVGNTIRLSTQKHEQNIRVMQLIGATDAMVRRPFLYTGLFYGFFGGIFAWLMVTLMRFAVVQPFYRLMSHYQSAYQLSGLGLQAGVFLLLSSSLLGLFGANLAVRRYLRGF